MTSVQVPTVDLAPGMPSRVVTISATDITEGGQSLAGQMVRFALSDSLDVTSGGDVIAKTQAEVVLDANGEGSIRLPVYNPSVKTWCGSEDWAILVTATWGSQKAIRVPVGTSSIALSTLPPVRPLRGREKQYALTGASVTVTEGGNAGGSVSLSGGVLNFRLTIPRGDWNKETATSWDFPLPGAYGIWTDTPNSPTPGTAQTWVAYVMRTPAGAGNLATFALSWSNPAQVWTRRKSGGVWSPWRRVSEDLVAQSITEAKNYTDAQIAALPEITAAADTGIHEHEMRLSHLRARVGAPRLGGKGAVTLIADHGTNNFASIVLPALRAAGLRCTLALNSQMYSETLYNHYAHENATTWAQIKGWHDVDGIEIANHGRTHRDATGEAAIRTEIRVGREELETALPGVPIDTWVQIGTTGDGTKWDGFEDGISLDRYFKTYAGRLILDSHALVTGQVPHGGTPNRVYPMTGHPPQGASGYWLDGGQAAIDTAKTKIDEAVAAGGGVILRLHPYLIDWTNQISSVQLTELFTYLKGRQDAGEIAVLPYREWALAVEW